MSKIRYEAETTVPEFSKVVRVPIIVVAIILLVGCSVGTVLICMGVA